MSQPPIVSILINNYNYGRFLREAIDSALDQTYQKVEVIVVDDGSTDNSREILATYGDRIIPVLKPNGGQASAFNAGLAASNGEIICFLDSDDVFERNKVEQIVRQLLSKPTAGWLFHAMYTFTADGKSELLADYSRISGEHDFRETMKGGKLPFIAPPTSGLCFRRELLSRILPMPEASSITLSDHYLKFCAAGLSPGLVSHEALSKLRIHGHNAYSFQGDSTRRAQILAETAFALRQQWPEFRKFANHCFAYARASLSRTARKDISPDHYLSAASMTERLDIWLRTHYLRMFSIYRHCLRPLKGFHSVRS
jgi:glycosyltransferase involved in cell wall biosynthesis